MSGFQTRRFTAPSINLYEKVGSSRLTGAQGEMCPGDISQLSLILGTIWSSTTQSTPQLMIPKLKGRAWKFPLFIRLCTGVLHGGASQGNLSQPARKQ